MEDRLAPTNRLRFVDRNEPVTLRGERFDNWRKVLQQWWVDEWLTGEWRDVPLEKEQ